MFDLFLFSFIFNSCNSQLNQTFPKFPSILKKVNKIIRRLDKYLLDNVTA